MSHKITSSSTATMWIRAAAAAAIMLGGATGAHAANGNNTFTVDDNFAVDTPAQRRFRTIQGAVDAAAPGATINVMPGVYGTGGDADGVQVSKASLTIRGARPSKGKTRLNFSNDSNDTIVDTFDSSKESIVRTNTSNTTGFSLAANNIAVSGFVVLGESGDDNGTTSGISDQTGIGTDASFSGYKIVNNVVIGNTVGVFFNSSGTNSSTLTDNAIVRNDENGSSAGTGVYSDAGLRNATISNNFFSGNYNAQVLISNPVTVTATETGKTKPVINTTITGNTVNAAASPRSATFDNTDTLTVLQATGAGFLLINVTNSVVSNNTIEGTDIGAGIYLANGTTNTTVSGNKLKNVARTSILIGSDDTGFGPTVAGLATEFNIIQSNTIINGGFNQFGNTELASSGFGGISDGIDLFSTTDNTLSKNTVTGSARDGISLQDADDNFFNANSSRTNADDGLDVDENSENNKFAKNTFTGNGDFDIEDRSTGAGDGGTANFYMNNKFGDSNVDFS